MSADIEAVDSEVRALQEQLPAPGWYATAACQLILAARQERDEWQGKADACAEQMTHEANGERDAARDEAAQYKRDWYAAKTEFGAATVKLRAERDAAIRERDEAREERKATFRGTAEVMDERDYLEARLDKVTAERDAARADLGKYELHMSTMRAQIETLRDERDAARRDAEEVPDLRKDVEIRNQQLTEARRETQAALARVREAWQTIDTYQADARRMREEAESRLASLEAELAKARHTLKLTQERLEWRDEELVQEREQHRVRVAELKAEGAENARLREVMNRMEEMDARRELVYEHETVLGWMRAALRGEGGEP